MKTPLTITALLCTAGVANAFSTAGIETAAQSVKQTDVASPGAVALHVAPSDAKPKTTPKAQSTNGRAMDSPFPSPPFPSSDWLTGPVLIGEPDSTPDYPLQKGLFGHSLDKSRIKVYGYVNASYNVSTSSSSNFPQSYGLFPNTGVLNQAVLRVERTPDTVQTDHQDWGFRFTSLYGTDYRFTTSKGYFSDQLLARNEKYGYDPVEAYAILYYPKVAEGMEVQIGRYISPPDIEAQLAPGNYTYSHSVMFTVDPYTFTGVNATIRLNQQTQVLFQAHAGNDTAPWERAASLNVGALIRYVTKDNKDSFWGGINSIGNGRFKDNHDDLQHLVGTWGHKFNEKVHMMTEAYYIWQYDAAVGGTAIEAPPQDFYTNVGLGNIIPGKSDATGLVNYLQFLVSPTDYITLRNDYLNDPQGQRTGYATAYTSHTLAYVKYLDPLTFIRPEIRYEHAYADGVTPYDNGTRKDQWTLSIDIIRRF